MPFPNGNQNFRPPFRAAYFDDPRPLFRHTQMHPVHPSTMRVAGMRPVPLSLSCCCVSVYIIHLARKVPPRLRAHAELINLRAYMCAFVCVSKVSASMWTLRDGHTVSRMHNSQSSFPLHAPSRHRHPSDSSQSCAAVRNGHNDFPAIVR